MMDPIVSSLISIIVVFIVVALILWLAKPAFVTKMDKDNKKVVLMDKLIAYSSLIAVATGLLVVLGMNMMEPKPLVVPENVKSAIRSRFGNMPVVVKPRSMMKTCGMRHNFGCGC
jgi:hypothetical protein